MEISTEFQTHPIVCKYMASMVKGGRFNISILEPTPGIGNLVEACRSVGTVISPTGDFWDFMERAAKKESRFDYVVMNPPFSPMSEGYRFLTACMSVSDNVIALVPWLLIVNSESRIKILMSFGLKSITHIPRKTFKGSKVQCCIIELKKGYKGETEFKHFTW